LLFRRCHGGHGNTEPRAQYEHLEFAYSFFIDCLIADGSVRVRDMTFDLRMLFHGLFGVCFALATIFCMRIAGATSFVAPVAPMTSEALAGAVPATDIIAASAARNDAASSSLSGEEPCCEDTLALPDRLAFVPCVIDAIAPAGGVPSPCGLPRRPAFRPPDV
jgi:hypothetical protein